MSSIDISQVPQLVADNAFEVMFEAYDEGGLVYPSLGRMIDPQNVSSPLYGNKGSVIQGMERFKKREDGQHVEKATTRTAFTWYGEIGTFSRSIDIPERMLAAVDASSTVPNLISEFSEGFGETARLQKEDFIADLFQKGTLSAGDAEFFDGSHPNNVDPYPKFVYDGLPFFDTAHTLSGSSSTISNHTASLTLSQANLQTVLTTMTSTNAVNERGERVMIRPNVLMVPPGLEFTAREIMGSLQQVDSANNNINPIAGRLAVVVNRALDDAASASAWWVGQAGRGKGAGR